MKPFSKRGDFSALYWEILPLKGWPSASALHAGCVACGHFHKPREKEDAKPVLQKAGGPALGQVPQLPAS